MRRFLRAALAAQGYRLVEAETAAEALIAATTHNPELILLDLGLPDGDGIDLTRRIREWSRVPIIVISARGREDDKVDRARRRRRRLPDQALRRQRAAGAHPGRAAPRAAAASATGGAGAGVRPAAARPRRAGRCCVAGAEVHLTPARVPAARAARAERRQGADPPPDPQGGLGARLP